MRIILSVMILVGLLNSQVFSQEEKEKGKSPNLIPGVEIVKMGSANVLVPEGALVQKRGSQLYVEDMGGYTGRTTFALEARIAELEKQQVLILSELAQLKNALEDFMNKRIILQPVNITSQE